MTTIVQQRLLKAKKYKELLIKEQELLSIAAIADLKNSRYRTLARPNQLPPEEDWRIWLVISGRGFGKTFLGAGWLAEQARTYPNTEWAIVAPTFTDVRRTCVEGPSGFLKAVDLRKDKGDFYTRYSNKHKNHIQYLAGKTDMRGNFSCRLIFFDFSRIVLENNLLKQPEQPHNEPYKPDNGTDEECMFKKLLCIRSERYIMKQKG